MVSRPFKNSSRQQENALTFTHTIDKGGGSSRPKVFWKATACAKRPRPAKVGAMLLKEAVEQGEVGLDDLSLSFQNLLLCLQGNDGEHFAGSAIADGEIVLEVGNLFEE